MKKLFLFLLILPLAFVACSDDDDDSIVGKWTYSKTTVTVETKGDTGNVLKNAIEAYYADEDDIDSNGTTEIETKNSTDTNTDWNIEFKADGTFIDDEGKEGTYTLKGNKLTIASSDFPEESYTQTISISGNTLSTIEDITEDIKADYKHGYIDEYVEEGKTIAKDATIEKVTEIMVFKRK